MTGDAEPADGESEEPAAEGATSDVGSRETTLRWLDKPLLVFVCDEAAGCEGFDKLEEIVLKDEKIGLAMRAFRTLKMHPDDVDADALLKDNGKAVPRMILVEPTKMKIRVLESKKIKVSSLFNAMKKTARGFYKEKLETVVKAHRKLLTEQDKIANEERTLNAQKENLDEGEDAKAKKIDERLSDIASRRKDLLEQKQSLWKLTRKNDSA